MSQVEHHGLVLPSSVEDRKRIKGALDEIVVCLTQVSSLNEHKKDIIATLSEEFDIPKKLISKVAKTMFDENFQKLFAEADDVETMIEGLQLTTALPTPTQPQ